MLVQVKTAVQVVAVVQAQTALNGIVIVFPATTVAPVLIGALVLLSQVAVHAVGAPLLTVNSCGIVNSTSVPLADTGIGLTVSTRLLGLLPA